jgi:hypothetical protein
LKIIAKMVYFMPWKMEFLNDRVRIELEAFPTDIVASFLRIVRLIELEGPAKGFRTSDRGSACLSEEDAKDAQTRN